MYSLRYWYEKKHEDGKVIRLEIHKKNNSAAPMEIGDVVQGLSLNIEGGEDNIDAPIVSTSLVMTFVDAYDHHEAKAKKCGNWAEFYTPDATLWKVVLLCKEAGVSAFRTLWGGYVTPDSYEEDLVYRGSVTIVARDNIGHLADFPFDATGDDYGTISLRELLAEAWVKIESPMALRAYDEWMQTEGVYALDTRLNVSAFKDKSWHETIEAALYAYGAAMRFIGDNEVMVSPLRYIANFGGSFTQSQPIFMTGATRMFTPAAKRIEETASYDLEAELQPLVKPSDFSGERTLLDRDSDIYGYYLSNTEEGKGWLSTDYHTIFFDPSSFGILEADSVENLKNQMYVVAIEDYAYTAEYSRYVLAQSAKVKVTFGTGFMRKRYTDANGMPTGGYYLVPRVGTITKAYFMISVTQNGVKQYLKPNGEWTATPNVFSKANDSGLTEIEHDIDLSDFTGTVLLKIEIGGIVATIPYVGISAFSIGTNEAVSLLQTNRVNTNYNEENNVIIKRDPVIAPAYNTTILPSIIKNGIFYLDGVTYKPAKAWAWAGGTPQQMAVYNHLQLLTFYAKPNNVIEGNIVNGDVSRFAHIWRFEGKEHILVSGRYNYISGFIEGAILREFARYESLWGSTGEAQLPATETSEETNRESSASSSSASSTYDNTTVVNIGRGGGGGASNLNDLQDVDVTASVAGSVLYFNGTSWVDKTIHSLLAELKAIGDWFYKTDDGKSIGTKFNFFSEQEVSANGLSTGSNGGGGLISQVFGTTAFGTIASESNSATFNAYAIDSLYKRIVSLEGKATAVSFVPTLTSGKQIGTISIDGVSTVLYGVDAYSKTETDERYLKLTGGTITGNTYIPLKVVGTSVRTSIGFSKDASTFAYLTYNGGSSWAVTNEYYNNEYTLYHTGNFNPANYLPLSGGTITGSLNVLHNSSVIPLLVENKAQNYTAIAFRGANSNTAYLVYSGTGDTWEVTNVNWTRTSVLLHSNNFGDYAVSKAGGTITKRDDGVGLVIDTPDTHWAGIRFKPNTASVGATLNYNGTDWRVTDDGWNQAFSLLHSGNYNSYSPKLDGTGASGTWGISISGNAKTLKTSAYPVINANEVSYTDCAVRFLSAIANTSTNLPTSTGYQNGMLVLPLHDNGSTAQMYFSKGDEHFYYRSLHTGAWKTIAFTDSNITGNAATATKLATARTIWGQSFDGTGNVTGALKTPSGYNAVTILDSYLVLGQGMAENSLPTYLDGYNVYMRHGKSSTIGFTLNSSGNVLIGTTTDKNSGKLQVDGGATIDGYKNTSSVKSVADLNGAGLVVGVDNTRDAWGISMWTEGNGYGYIQQQAFTSAATTYPLCLQPFGGSVGIGTTSPAYKLDVNGSVGIGTTGASDLVLRRTNGFSYITAASHLALSTNNDTTNIAVGISTNKDVTFYGKVSVGTSSASEALHINGSLRVQRFGDAASYLNITANDISVNYYGYDTGDGYVRHRFYSNDTLLLNIDGKDKILYISGGLSTTSATTLQSTLSVVGTITANSGVKVASGQALTFLDASGKEHKLTYDSTAGAFKFDGNVYATQEVSANGIGTSGTIETTTNVNLSIDGLMSLAGRTDVSQSTMDIYGLTTDVVNKMLAGKYNKILGNSNTAGIWDYDCWQSNTGNATINLKQGDGISINQAIILKQVTRGTSLVWSVIFAEI